MEASSVSDDNHSMGLSYNKNAPAAGLESTATKPHFTTPSIRHIRKRVHADSFPQHSLQGSTSAAQATAAAESTATFSTSHQPHFDEEGNLTQRSIFKYEQTRGPTLQQ